MIEHDAFDRSADPAFEPVRGLRDHATGYEFGFKKREQCPVSSQSY